MIDLLFENLRKFATPKILKIGFGIILFFNVVLLPLFPKLYSVEIPINEVLDLQFSYTSEEVYSLFEKIGENGRKAYFFSEIFIDGSYLLFYGVFYAVLIVFLIERKKAYRYKTFVLLPFAIAFSDLSENIGIVFLLRYPEKSEFIVSLTSFFTSLKWILAGILLVFLLFLIFGRKIPPSKP